LKAMRAEVERAHADATPIAHAGHGARKAARPQRDRHRAATPAGDQDLRAHRRHRRDPRSRAARAQRGGQVYLLHNEVETIQNRRQKLEEILPEARIAVAHGQMPERDLERVMRDFVAQRYNLLLCSTIIETGIDVPTANTIVMSRADNSASRSMPSVARPRGPQPSPGLRLPDGAGHRRPDQACAQRLDAIQQMEELDRASTWRCTTSRSAAPASARREPERQHAGDRLPALQRDAVRKPCRSLKAGHEPDLLAPLSVTTEINLHAPAAAADDYCATCICGCRSTRSWRPPRRPTRSTRCWRRSSTASASCRRKPRR